jgi:hypothetical protein
MHLFFPTSLDTLFRSSKAEKQLNLICRIVLLFTLFTLPSTDKLAEKMSNSPDTSPFYLLYCSPPYFAKTFLGERKQPWDLNIVSIIPSTLSFHKICLFLSPLSFSPPLFFPFLLLFLTYLFIITYSYT